MALLTRDATPQEARSVLPNSLKTEVIMTANLREWRHFFKLRASKAAHPQMREIAIPLLLDLQNRIPVVFDDILIV
jgi:thymidylate synthase (FAD)